MLTLTEFWTILKISLLLRKVSWLNIHISVEYSPEIAKVKPPSRTKQFREEENIGIEGEEQYIYEEEEEEDEEEEEIRDTQAIRNNTRGGGTLNFTSREAKV